MQYHVLDTETIGLNPPPEPASGVVQVAWAEIHPISLDVIYSHQQLINPQAPIHPEASKVHGWYETDVIGEPNLEEVYSSAQPTVLICHNVAFDVKFVGRYIQNLAGTLCTLTLARHYVRDSKNHKLATLAEYFGLDTGKAHDAGGDVHTTVQLLRKLVEISGKTLPELVAANRVRTFHVMPFGMHKGKRFSALPVKYLEWFLEQEIDEDLRHSITQELRTR